MRAHRLQAIFVSILLSSAIAAIAENGIMALRAAAKNGDPHAQAVLGETYLRGEGTTHQDHELAYQWIKASAKQKHPLGLYNMALLYENGIYMQKDARKASYLYRLSAPGLKDHAEKGDPRAMLYLAAMHRTGKAVPQNMSEALRLHREAAKSGFPRAQYEYANLLFTGDGITQDYASALSWFQRAADGKYAPAAHSIGLMYYHGKGVDRDYEEAMEWFLIAAEKQHAPSQCNLGTIYYKGKGAQKNIVKAEEWYRQAADAGYARAQFNVGVLYLEAAMTDQDRRDAVTWIQRAADQGSTEARRKLAELDSTKPTKTARTEEHKKKTPMKTTYKTTKVKVSQPVMMGMKLGMNIEEACQLLNRSTGKSFKVKRDRAGLKYTVPYKRTHSLITAGADKKVMQFDFPQKVVDDLFKAPHLDGPAFVKSFAEWMNLPPLVPGPTVAARGQTWTYKSTGSFELIMFGDRGLILKEPPATTDLH